jgi:hypothetical protein
MRQIVQKTFLAPTAPHNSTLEKPFGHVKANEGDHILIKQMRCHQPHMSRLGNTKLDYARNGRSASACASHFQEYFVG